MNPAIKLRNEKAGQKLVTALKKRHFDAYYCATKEDALKQALALIPKDHTVAWGGSASAAEIGLLDAVKANYKCIDRDTATTPEERIQIQRQTLLSDTFITGTNAVSEDGQLVNVDGNGNRVAAMTFGPSNVIVICGINKMTKTLEDACTRARTVAAPINAQRFGDLGTPCSKNGTCADCTSDNCICCYMVTTRCCRPAGKIKVIVVGEEVGF
ncbi:MAG: lactate utilization protein [Lachnospiraceae bacterium]|nr:lactate utilization protein [Lachnospiraceae bacterium]